MPVAVAAREIHVAPGGTGNGDPGNPLGAVQDGLSSAEPGDVVLVHGGTYSETLETSRNGEADSPIAVRAAGDGEVLIVALGRVLRVLHANHVFQGLVLDGQYGDRDAVQLGDDAHATQLRSCEVRRSGRDCIDLGSPSGVVFEGCSIHHCLNSDGGRTDAHGITGGAVVDLRIEDTEIHTFSGDAIQFDPGREAPGWDRVEIIGCRLWLEPLPAPENGFAAGTVPGENALDTKTWNDASPANLVIRNTVAYGYRNGLISNMAAFNLKENVDVHVDGVTVFDSEIAFRLRGATGSRPRGAQVHIRNAVIYDVDKAFRYEDDIEPVELFHVTLGRDVASAFQRASAPQGVIDASNLLLLGDTLPEEVAGGAGNRVAQASAFRDAAGDDYHLLPGSPAEDSGVDLPDVAVDRDGVSRPQGDGWDVGAYELGSIEERELTAEVESDLPADADEAQADEQESEHSGDADAARSELAEGVAERDDPADQVTVGPVSGPCGCAAAGVPGGPVTLLVLLLVGCLRRSGWGVN